MTTNKHKDLGVSAYQPIRTKSSKGIKIGVNSDLNFDSEGLSNNKHSPQHTKSQFKKRRDKHGHVKIIRVR
jgi:hypothetical protein|tara:strand:+ start:334 stop:546 length:213 start_codon:yes stop_codon:yes gene_type:complete